MKTKQQNFESYEKSLMMVSDYSIQRHYENEIKIKTFAFYN